MMPPVVSVNVNDLFYAKTGTMTVIYPHSKLVQDLASLLSSNGIDIPDNKRIYDTKPRNKFKVSPETYLNFHYRLMGELERFRMRAVYSRNAISSREVVNKLYYFVGVCNMLSYVRSSYHSFDWTEKTLLFKPSSRCFIFDTNFKTIKKCLVECCLLYEDQRFKNCINKFIKGISSISRYLSQWFEAIDFTKFNDEKMFDDFGFRKVALSETNQFIYLLPGYLIGSLDDKDNLEGATEFEEESYYYFDDYKDNLKETILGAKIKRSYIPFYSDGTHILYGFKIVTYNIDSVAQYEKQQHKKKKKPPIYIDDTDEEEDDSTDDTEDDETEEDVEEENTSVNEEDSSDSELGEDYL